MRPEEAVDNHFRLNRLQKSGLVKLGINTVRDLLYHLPSRYGEPAAEKMITELAAGEEATIYGQVTTTKISKAWRKKIPLGEIVVEDGTGEIKAVWFHQPYLAKKVAKGHIARLQGKVAERRGELYLANPEIEPVSNLPDSPESLFADSKSANYLIPVYPETRHLSSTWLRHTVKKALRQEAHLNFLDPLPQEIIKRYNLPTLTTALIWIHSPKKEADALAARKRFAFEEVFKIQLSRLRLKQIYQTQDATPIKIDPAEVKDFVADFPFSPTGAQNRAIEQILKDLSADKPMTRLLEGDVGSGKTAVAATAAFVVAQAGYQIAYMAPTEILARQHFESFITFFRQHNLAVGLLTSAECRKFPSKIDPSHHTHISRSQLLKWAAEGIIPIVVGTHALIQKSVQFKKLAYVIIDEQHRFGVMQRAGLARKNATGAPHLLTMTATPIPRTLALTIYGDLDLTLLDELPAGRKPIVTEIVDEENREKAYEKIRREIKEGRQAYIICPRIDEPDPTKALALQTKSAKKEKARLQKNVFPEYELGLVHSKLKPKEKGAVMADFTAGEINILVATSVVEVGVNVPNATIIVIEGAERFGLAQLHQLRGRVFRSSHQAYCFLFTDLKSQKVRERLKALAEAKSGFELAELDLKLRGAGVLSGIKQWGLSDVGMEALKNLKMVEAARSEAQKIIATDPELKNYPLLAAQQDGEKKEIHFE